MSAIDKAEANLVELVGKVLRGDDGYEFVSDFQKEAREILDAAIAEAREQGKAEGLKQGWSEGYAEATCDAVQNVEADTPNPYGEEQNNE